MMNPGTCEPLGRLVVGGTTLWFGVPSAPQRGHAGRRVVELGSCCSLWPPEDYRSPMPSGWGKLDRDKVSGWDLGVARVADLAQTRSSPNRYCTRSPWITQIPPGSPGVRSPVEFHAPLIPICVPIPTAHF